MAAIISAPICLLMHVPGIEHRLNIYKSLNNISVLISNKLFLSNQ